MELSGRARRRSRKGFFFLLILLIAWLAREPLLKGAGHFLISENLPESPSDVLVILGGNSYERGQAALRLDSLYNYAEIWCSGGNIPTAFLALDTLVTESELTARFLSEAGLRSERLNVLNGSTSTWEEAQAIRKRCDSLQIPSITVLSSAFHTRRVDKVFKKAFAGSETGVYTAAAPPLTYDLDAWWKSESGLIMVNNEYMKTLYYLIKH